MPGLLPVCSARSQQRGANPKTQTSGSSVENNSSSSRAASTDSAATALLANLPIIPAAAAAAAFTEFSGMLASISNMTTGMPSLSTVLDELDQSNPFVADPDDASLSSLWSKRSRSSSGSDSLPELESGVD
jgi:hypothetical protein